MAADATAMADIVITIGGASVGERDLAKAAFLPLGLELIFAKVAIKPGKPIWFGRAGKTLVVGLPGNPSSALVTARLFLAPLLAGLSGGQSDDALDFRMMRTSRVLESSPDRDIFSRGTIKGRLATPLADQDSAGQKALAAATHLIRRRPSAVPDAETLVETLVF
jgi:molybdopterin molybdotransferase